MKDIEKTKEQLIWDIKKLKQQSDKHIYAKTLELKQLNQVLETVTSTLDLDIVVEKVSTVLNKIFDFNQVSIYLFNSDTNTLDINHWFGHQVNDDVIQKYVNFPLSIEWDDAYFIKSFLDNETLYISPITEKLLTLYSDCDRQMFEWNPHKSILIVPLQVQEKVIGVINFVNTDEAFTLENEDIERIERYVSQIATTINNAYLVKKTNYTLQRAQANEKEINHLNKVIQATNESLDFDEVFGAILTGLKDVFDFEAIGIQLVDEKHELLNIFKVYGDMIKQTHIDQWRSIQISANNAASVSSYVFAKGEMALFPNITPDMPFAEIDLKIFNVMSFAGYLAFPLTVRSQKIGVISFFRRTKAFNLDEQKITKISRYVDTLSSTIKNSKTYHELQNSYFRIDSLLNASIELYHLKSVAEITQFSVNQLIEAFPGICLSMTFQTHLDKNTITTHHSTPHDVQALFNTYTETFMLHNTEEQVQTLISCCNQLNQGESNSKDDWKVFTFHSTEALVFGHLILNGVNLNTQNKNTLKLFMHQIVSALENRTLVEKLGDSNE